ncbi:MAG: hypothetical protein M1591_07150 [Deltaproteobacteria bacterium]|nr:hypothetical protein [Deltaproteobacteria bacterium]
MSVTDKSIVLEPRNLKQRLTMPYKKMLLFMLSFAFLCGCHSTTAFAGYLTRGPISEDHRDFYIGTATGAYIPTGPDQSGYATGVGISFHVGYQFIKYLSAELGYHGESGSFNSNGVKGGWQLIEPVDVDIKPILPLSAWDNVYMVFGTGFGGYDDRVIEQIPGRDVGLQGFIYNIGIGYERYLHDGHFSISCAVVYRSFTSKQAISSVGGQTDTFTLPYRIDRSKLAVEIWVFWRFFRNKK